MTAEGKPDAQTVRRVLEMIREPSTQHKRASGTGTASIAIATCGRPGIDYLIRNAGEVAV